MASQHEIRHPIIGNVTGKSTDGVAQFLGIKYATLNHWFDNAQLVQYDNSGMVADRYGPQAISDPAGVHQEHLIIQKALPVAEFPGISGTECLNLNITVPLRSHDSPSLPVSVFIHGGGFMTGSNWWPEYDMKRFVQLSVKRGKPIIAININYRLGASGFMTSEELRQNGFKSNHGHHDQRVALQWVKRFVAGFGGDPENVTVIGESAGGISTTRLINPDESLASRIIVLGGSPPALSPLAPEAAEQAYQSVLKALAAEDLSSAGRIKALSQASPEDVLNRLDKSIHFMPVVDEETVPFVPAFDMAAGKTVVPRDTSCKAAMIGYAPLDASIFGSMGLLQRKQSIAASFTKSITSSLATHPDVARQLLDVYGIDESRGEDDAFMNILRFGSDVAFQASARFFASSFPGDSLLLEFAEKNPWNGPFEGHSTHVLDVAFLFQNYNEHLDQAQKTSAGLFAEDVIDFVNGDAPWKTFQDAGVWAVYEDGARKFKEGPHTGNVQYDKLMELGGIVGLDILMEAWTAFLFHP